MRNGGIQRKRANSRGKSRTLTHGGEDNNPDWSPDGRRFVFERYREDPETEVGTYQLAILRLGTRGVRTLTPLSIEATDPAWSVRGLVAFTVDRSVIYTIRPNGTGLRRMVRGSEPDWSPDGKRLVFVTRRGRIATIGANGRGLHRVTRGRRRRDSSPSFSPRGRRITFVRGNDLYVTGRQGRSPKRILRMSSRLGYTCPYECTLSDTDWQPLPSRR